MTNVALVKLPSDECNWILLMISQHWFRYWLGAVRQQAITWANVDPVFCRQMAPLGPNELMQENHTLQISVTKIYIAVLTQAELNINQQPNIIHNQIFIE